MKEEQRVVVTGMGLVSSLGMDEDTVWNNMMDGKTGIQRISAFDTESYKAKNGAEVDTEALKGALKEAGIRPNDRTVDMGLIAALRALEQAGLRGHDDTADERLPLATIIGTGIGSSQSMYNAFTSFAEKGLRGIRPTSVPRCMANAVSSQISLRFKLTGPNYVIVSACSSATTAIGQGYRMIKDGYIEGALCGGSDDVFDPFVYGGWNNMGVISTIEDPAACCRPFAEDRAGCILGEGAGMLILESLKSAEARGATIRAEVIGFGESSDAKHMTGPSPEGQVRAIKAALASADITPNDVDFINAHGTATHANDSCESQSIRMGLGPAADTIPVASNKSFFGHLLGAAGAVESIVTILGLEQGTVPGNLNLDNPDPECNVCLVGKDPKQLPARIAMKNSFGFGGNNAVLLLRKWA